MSYKPYKVKRSNRDIYSKYDNRSKNKKPKNNKRDGRIKLFGFRSGASYKMILALVYYAFAIFYVGSGIYGEISYYEFEAMDVVLTIFKYVFWIVAFFAPAIFLSDFKYRDSLPFFRKRTFGSSLAGLILVWIFCFFMANVNIYCMSDTYKDSQERYQQILDAKEEQEESTDQQDEDSTQLDDDDVEMTDTMFYNEKNNTVYI